MNFHAVKATIETHISNGQRQDENNILVHISKMVQRLVRSERGALHFGHEKEWRAAICVFMSTTVAWQIGASVCGF